MSKKNNLFAIEIEDSKKWENFVRGIPHATFLQSWFWGEFHESLGIKVYHRAVTDGAKIKAAALVLVMSRKVAKFLYVPQGPTGDLSDKKIAKILFSDLKDLAKKEGADYIRIDPRVPGNLPLEKLLKDSGFKRAPSAVHAEVGWVLDLSTSEDEMLKNMRETTRYLIRKAPKMGVKVEISKDDSSLETFHDLMDQTVSRQGFTPHNRTYIQKQFEILSREGLAKLFIASYEGSALAAAIIVRYGDTASYVHGASLTSKIPASYILQWEAVRDAKEAGLSLYDFWGIAPTENKSHPWYGLSLFKKGFGGREIRYVGAWDIPLTSRYRAVQLIEKTRKFLRRL